MKRPAPPYVPARGDLLWLDFDPKVGEEIGKRRPAVVISEAEFNRKRQLCFVAPVSKSMTKAQIEVELPANLGVEGAVMVDQVRSLDWRLRHAERIGRVPPRILEDVLDRVCAILGVQRRE